jgi:hypothetical protein
MKKILILSIVIALYSCKKDDPVAPPPAPVATNATNFSTEGFMATWINSVGAIDYELDVATDAGFTSIVETQKNLAGSTNVSGLTSNTEYYYRVRATINGANPSSNSNTISATTLPDAPLALAATANTSSGFTANWQAVSGITTYLLYVSKNNFPATPPPNNVSGYDGLEVTGTSHDVRTLDAGTFYYYVLKAKGIAHNSVESNSILTETSN